MEQVSAQTVAWIAVIGATGGALIGATAGGLVDFLLERARERRDAKVGARLVRLDLAVAADQIKAAEGEYKWWTFYNTRMEGWQAHRASLAARVDDDDFELITQAVAELQRFHEDMQQAPLVPDASFRLLSPTSVEALQRMRRNATVAYNALATLAKGKTVEGLLHG